VVRALIATHPSDLHAAVVALALRKKGHTAVLWYGADFPTKQRGTLEIDGTTHSWSMVGEELDERATRFDVVWFRRPRVPTVPDVLHPGDRKVAERAAAAFYRAFWHLVAPDAFWVNPLSSAASDIKPLQLVEAARVGFTIPATLCSNDPDRIRAFLARHRGETIFKSFLATQWKTDEGFAELFTKPVGLDDLPDDDLLQFSTGIFQRKINKKHELRVTAVGEHLFAAKLHSQENELARDDWRAAFNTLRLEATELPAEVSARCIALMRKLGIVFGCFDFIVTPDDEYVFLEVNPMGQFLLVEDSDPSILLTEAFCDLLIQHRAQFEWAPPRDGLRYAELRSEALALRAEAMRRHVRPSEERAVKDSTERPDLGP
jgi:hypothetical protein